jgi:hypothetical protein
VIVSGLGESLMRVRIPVTRVAVDVNAIALASSVREAMPELSRFLGIVIYMYHRDHAPAHFHAEYAEFEISVDIESGRVTGKFPRRALNLVMEWYSLYKVELAADWKRAQARQPLKAIDPLE